jgi:hypothetical protein
MKQELARSYVFKSAMELLCISRAECLSDKYSVDSMCQLRKANWLSLAGLTGAIYNTYVKLNDYYTWAGYY